MIEAITCDWLSSRLDVTVRNFTSERLAGGYMSDVFRLTLDAEGCPDSVILKLPASNPAMRELSEQYQSTQKELRFYRESPTLAVPECYSTDEGILLQDLGDPATTELSFALAQSAVEACATVATFEFDADPFSTPFLTAAEDMAGFVSSVLLDQSPGSEVNFLKQYASQTAKHLPLFNELPQVFAHLDFRAGNLRFLQDRCFLFDWGDYAHAPIGFDLANLLVTSLTTEDRRSWESDLMSYYQSKLHDQGMTIDRDTLERGYRLALPQIYYLPALMTIRGDTDNARIIGERCINAISDHLSFLNEEFR